MPKAKRAAKKTAKRKLKLYQIVVRLRRSTVHASETASESVGRKRAERETIRAGIGAAGVLYRVDRSNNDALVPCYEVRAVYKGKAGAVGTTPEDHTTPPVPPTPTPETPATPA